MTSLVLQLQADVLDPASRISDLLRKVKVVAAKLGLTDIQEWVEHELQGYPNDATLPEYRDLTGQVKFFNPIYGWRPVICHDGRLEQIISRCPVYQSIASIEEVLARSAEAGYLISPIAGEKQAILSKMVRMMGVSEFQLHVSPGAFFGILDGVRNRVLDWACTLEKAGILGEGLSFSVKEKEAAIAMSGGNVYHIQGNVGVLGDVNHSTVTANQNANYTAEQLHALHDAVEQIGTAVGQLGAGIQKPVAAAVEEIRAELQQAQPDSGKLRKAIASIRTTCEGAAGNLIASGIVGLIAKFLG